MERINYRMEGGLQPEQIENMIADAYWIIEKIGVTVEPDILLEEIAGQPGFHMTGHNVRIDPDVASHCFQAAQPTDVVNTRSFVMDNGGNTLMISDLHKGEARPPKIEDLIEMSKLCDSFDLKGYPPVLPQDVPLALQEIAANYYARYYSRYLGGGVVSTSTSAEFIYEMSQIAGPPFRLEYYVASPLSFDSTGLDIILRFRGRGVPVAVGSYLLAGNSAPLSLAAAWTQWLAENIAAVALMTYACPDDRIHWMTDGGAHAFDFRYTNMRAGAPEELLFRLAGIQIMRYMGIKARGTVSVLGKQPDARTTAERLAG